MIIIDDELEKENKQHALELVKKNYQHAISLQNFHFYMLYLENQQKQICLHHLDLP